MAPQPDWHLEDIKSAIRKTDLTCEGLAVLSGYERSAVRIALRRSWPRVEQLIARHLGVDPWAIWPSRYDDQHQPIRGSAKRRGGHSPTASIAPLHRKTGEAA